MKSWEYRDIPLEDRLMEKVVWNGDPDECWLWEGSKDASGYGKIRTRGPLRGTHRVAYELFVGPIPDGLEIDHLCRVRNCINPAHLEAVTHWENCDRGTAAEVARAKAEAQTHCKHGHEFTEANTYRYGPGRRYRKCRTCDLARHNAAYAAKKAVEEEDLKELTA